MGNGASANVKKVTLKNNITKVSESNDELNSWCRSNSDGCIVETLNSSRTKVDLLEQQIDELQDLLATAEDSKDAAQQQAQIMEIQLTSMETSKFEFLDRIEELEERLAATQEQVSERTDEELMMQLSERDQVIEKLEVQVQELVNDMAIVKAKAKKRVKAANMELAELRQDNALKTYRYKDEIKNLEEENARLSERLERASSASRHPSAPSQRSLPSAAAQESDDADSDQETDPRNMLIVELSNQLSSQESLIEELKEKILEKEKTLIKFDKQNAWKSPKKSIDSSKALSGSCVSSERIKNISTQDDVYFTDIDNEQDLSVGVGIPDFKTYPLESHKFPSTMLDEEQNNSKMSKNSRERRRLKARVSSRESSADSNQGQRSSSAGTESGKSTSSRLNSYVGKLSMGSCDVVLPIGTLKVENVNTKYPNLDNRTASQEGEDSVYSNQDSNHGNKYSSSQQAIKDRNICFENDVTGSCDSLKVNQYLSEEKVNSSNGNVNYTAGSGSSKNGRRNSRTGSGNSRKSGRNSRPESGSSRSGSAKLKTDDSRVGSGSSRVSSGTGGRDSGIDVNHKNGASPALHNDDDVECKVQNVVDAV